MSVYATKAFWAGTFERAVKTLAQSLIAVIGTGTLGILEVDWLTALSVAGLATVLSVLTSVAQPEFVAGDADATPPPEGWEPQHRAPTARELFESDDD